MKIGIISQFYDPEVGSAAQTGAIARALARRGNSVSVLTGFPNYPTGKIYDGYKISLHQKEQVDNVTVHRVPIYPSHDSRPLHRILNFVSFSLSSLFYSLRCLRHVDTCIVYSTAPTIVFGALLNRFVRGKPFIILIEDLWPDSLLASGMLPKKYERIAVFFTRIISRVSFSQSSSIAVISPTAKQVLIQRGVPESKITVIYNWADEHTFKPRETVSSYKGTIEFQYAGNLGDIQGLDLIISAFARLPLNINARIRFIGTGVAENRLRSLVDDLGLKNRVLFDGHKSLSDIARLMHEGDVQIVSLGLSELSTLTIPSKFQAITASGLPLLTIAPGDVATLTAQSGAGISVPPGLEEELTKAMLTFACMDRMTLDQFGRNSRAFYDKELSEEIGANKLTQLLKRGLFKP